MQYAQKTAFTAMSSMAEMGVIQDFLRASFACDTPASLAARLIEAVQCYGLACQVRFAVNGSWLAFSSRGEATPLEYGMLEHAARMDRIFQFRDRLSISYPNLTLIVYPLPLDDAELVGRLRDHLAVLAEGAEARLLALENVRRQQAQASGIHAIVVRLSATIDEVGRKQADSRLRAGEIDENFLREQVNAFVNLGLSEDQENRLADLGQRTHQKLAALRDIDATLSDQLRGVVAELRALVAR
jgi:hypothetical protein